MGTFGFVLLLTCAGLQLAKTSEHEYLPSSGYVSGLGVLRHSYTGKNIQASGNDCPKDGDTLKIGSTTVESRMKFRFVQVEGHFGYIEHHCGELVVQSRQGRLHPGDNTQLRMTSDRTYGANFYFDEEDNRIVHRGGQVFWPAGDLIVPGEGNEVRLHSNANEAARFEFVPDDGSGPVYPPPQLSGRWEIVFAVIDPISEHTYQLNYTMGKFATKTVTQVVSWKVSAGAAYEWFQADAEYNEYACSSESVTWGVEASWSITLGPIPPGNTYVMWQWVFEAERLGESLQFRSNLIGDTDDISRPPSLPLKMYPYAC